jgi:hypothetical protein
LFLTVILPIVLFSNKETKNVLQHSTAEYARTNVNGSRTSFIIATIEIYVFRGNPFQAQSLEQSYHPTQPFKQEKYNTKYKCKNNIK